jgi:hypothetical protein
MLALRMTGFACAMMIREPSMRNLGIGGCVLAGWIVLSAASPAEGGAGYRVGASTVISADDAASRHVESVLAIDPRAPRRLVTASVVFGTRGGVAVYASQDGGASWVRGVHGPHAETAFGELDPALAFDEHGDVWLATIGQGVQVWRSRDGGKSWDGPRTIPGSWDRPWIAAVGERLFVVGKLPITVFGQRAQDVLAIAIADGDLATFGAPRLLLPDPTRELLNVPSDVVVTPGGELVVGLQLFAPEMVKAGPLLTGNYATAISNGGRLSAPRPGPTFHTFGHRAEEKSAFGYGFARLAIDRSAGPRSGRLYMTFLDVVDGHYRVAASWSADSGEHWTAPVRVDDGTMASDASNPAIAVDGSGVVGVVWNDRRDDPSERCFRTYFAVSTDGGASFSPNQRVSDRFTCPLGAPPSDGGTRIAPDPSIDAIASQYRFKNGGDTQGIVGLPEGGFVLAWIDGGAGELALRATTIRPPQ